MRPLAAAVDTAVVGALLVGILRSILCDLAENPVINSRAKG
jgi:hypothetical protein